MCVSGFTPGELPSREYLARAKPVLETSMMYGAMRLAVHLKDIYSSSKQQELFLH